MCIGYELSRSMKRAAPRKDRPMTISLFLALLFSAPARPACVTAHLLDGRMVVMCEGQVTRVSDQLGNVRSMEVR